MQRARERERQRESNGYHTHTHTHTQAQDGAVAAEATALTKESCVATVALNHLAVLCILYPEHILHHLDVVLDLQVLAEGQRGASAANPSRPTNSVCCVSVSVYVSVCLSVCLYVCLCLCVCL